MLCLKIFFYKWCKTVVASTDKQAHAEAIAKQECSKFRGTVFLIYLVESLVCFSNYSHPMCFSKIVYIWLARDLSVSSMTAFPFPRGCP